MEPPQKAYRALELISEGITSGKGAISYQVVQEFFNFALRKAKTPMTIPDAEQYLQTIFRPLLLLHSSEALFGEALHVHGRYRLSWYDELMVASAIQAESAILYSEDLQHGQRFGNLQIQNPFF